MRTTSIKLPESLDHQLTVLARHRRTSRSEVLREALELLTGRESYRRLSEIAGDLVGAFQGPEDLATDPKHMAGFGR